MNIQPTDILPNGTKVAVHGKLGTVISHEEAYDQFRLPIVVHVVKFYSVYSHTTCGKPVYKPCKGTSRVNYSFIQTL